MEASGYEADAWRLSQPGPGVSGIFLYVYIPSTGCSSIIFPVMGDPPDAGLAAGGSNNDINSTPDLQALLPPEGSTSPSRASLLAGGAHSLHL